MMKIIQVAFIFLVCKTLFSQTPTQTANAYYDSGLDKMRKGWLKEAIADFTKCIEISPYYYEAYTQRGKCYFDLGKKQEALQDYETSLQKRKDYYLAFYYRAIYYRDAQKKDLAYLDIGKSIELAPRFKDAYNTRIQWFMEDQRYEEALKDIARIQELDDQLSWEVLKGKIWFLQGKDEQALEQFSLVIKKNSSLAEAWYHRGMLYEKKEEWQKAFDDLKQARKLGLNDTTLHVHLYNLAMKVEQYQDALNSANVLVGAGKKNARYWLWRGMAFMKLTQYDSAIVSFNKAISLQPSYEEAYLRRAECRVLKGKETAAFADYNKVLQLNPKNVEAYESRGVYFFNKKQYDKALEDLNNAIKFGAGGRAYFYRGAIKDMQGDAKGGCLDLKKAVELKYPDANKAYERACGMIK